MIDPFAGIYCVLQALLVALHLVPALLEEFCG
jgi:hypothetical protein